MDLVVGKNTYFTLEECEEIIASTYMSTDSKRVFWNNLSEDDKKVLIVSTHKKIDKDSMCYIGCKADFEQPMQFPRIVYTEDGTGLLECPYDIKLGTVLAMLDIATKAVSNEAKLRELGVTNYKVKDASISFGELPYTKNSTNGISNEYFWDFFKQYTILV